jgi:nucleoside-diphosphate-sugar epimerase
MKHLIVGSGPVGTGVAKLLVGMGIGVTIVTRRGSNLRHPLIVNAIGDAGDNEFLTALALGSSVIYNCANPAYHRWRTDWPPIHKSLMIAAEKSGAVLVMTDNFYSFDSRTVMPMRENSSMNSLGAKGLVRATMARELLEAHRCGRIRATLARASDFFGPDVYISQFGERRIRAILESEKVLVLGNLDMAHSLSYMPDVARTLVTIASNEIAWGKSWHVPNAPAVTQRESIKLIAKSFDRTVQLAETKKLNIYLKSLNHRHERELLEILWQWEQPFYTDCSITENTFGIKPTPLEEALESTAKWWLNSK